MGGPQKIYNFQFLNSVQSSQIPIKKKTLNIFLNPEKLASFVILRIQFKLSTKNPYISTNRRLFAIVFGQLISEESLEHVIDELGSSGFGPRRFFRLSL